MIVGRFSVFGGPNLYPVFVFVVVICPFFTSLPLVRHAIVRLVRRPRRLELSVGIIETPDGVSKIAGTPNGFPRLSIVKHRR